MADEKTCFVFCLFNLLLSRSAPLERCSLLLPLAWWNDDDDDDDLGNSAGRWLPLPIVPQWLIKASSGSNGSCLRWRRITTTTATHLYLDWPVHVMMRTGYRSWHMQVCIAAVCTSMQPSFYVPRFTSNCRCLWPSINTNSDLIGQSSTL